jgi:hypothetical protein
VKLALRLRRHKKEAGEMSFMKQKTLTKDDSSLRTMRAEIAAARKGKATNKKSRSLFEIARIFKKRQAGN